MLISRHELKDLCVEGLKAKRSALIVDLARMSTPFAAPTLALACLEIVNAELLSRAFARVSEVTPFCWL
jgi:hypothetical protein